QRQAGPNRSGLSGRARTIYGESAIFPQWSSFHRFYRFWCQQRDGFAETGFRIRGGEGANDCHWQLLQRSGNDPHERIGGGGGQRSGRSEAPSRFGDRQQQRRRRTQNFGNLRLSIHEKRRERSACKKRAVI